MTSLARAGLVLALALAATQANAATPASVTTTINAPSYQVTDLTPADGVEAWFSAPTGLSAATTSLNLPEWNTGQWMTWGWTAPSGWSANFTIGPNTSLSISASYSFGVDPGGYIANGWIQYLLAGGQIVTPNGYDEIINESLDQQYPMFWSVQSSPTGGTGSLTVTLSNLTDAPANFLLVGSQGVTMWVDEVTPVPEPDSLVLGATAAGLMLTGLRRRRG